MFIMVASRAKVAPFALCLLGGQLRFELCQIWLVCIQLLLQRNVFRCQLLQRLQFAVVKLVDSLCFFVCFDFCAMLLIEFC